MNAKQRWLLRASAGWNVYVWSVLIKNMVKDREHSLKFRAVHVVLGGVSTAFAVGTWWVARSASA